MEAWTFLLYVYFIAENVSAILSIAAIFGLMVLFYIDVFWLDDITENKEEKTKLRKKGVKWYLTILLSSVFMNVVVLDRDQMKTLVGVEITSRIAHSEDALRIANKSIEALERLIDRLAKDE